MTSSWTEIGIVFHFYKGELYSLRTSVYFSDINIKWSAEMSQIPHAILSVHYLQFHKVTHFRPKHAKPRPCYTVHKKSTVEDAIWFQEIKFRPMPWRILNTVCIAEVALCVTLLFKSSSLNLLKQLINKVASQKPIFVITDLDMGIYIWDFGASNRYLWQA